MTANVSQGRAPSGPLARCNQIAGVLAAARSVGLDAYHQAFEVGLPPASLIDPQLVVSALAINQLYENIAERSGRDDFALLVVKARRPTLLGIVGNVADEQPTVRQAIEVMSRYGWLENAALSVHLEEARDVAVVRFGLPPWAGRQLCDLHLGAWLRGFHDGLEPGWGPQAVWHTFPPPRRIDTYRELFRTSPAYDQEFLGFSFDRRVLDTRIEGRNSQSAMLAIKHLKDVAGEENWDIASAVRRSIQAILPTGECTMEAVAAHLSMDRRTLHRKLAGEGIMFKTILDEIRIQSAATLLQNQRRSLQSVSEQLGFSSTSTFAHWFRRNFNCAATAYRANLATS